MHRLVSPGLSVLLIAAAAGCAPAPRDRCESNKELVRRYLQVFNTGAVEELAQIVSPGYSEVAENAVHAIGLEGATAHVLGVRAAFPDLSITIEQQIAEGDWVVSRITVRGTHSGPWLGMAPSGQEMVFTGVNVDRVVDGRIVEHGGAANLLGTLLRAGVIRPVDPDTPP